MDPCNNCLVVHVEYLDTSIVLGMIQSMTILDQLLNEEVIRDNAFKLAKHAKNSLRWIGCTC